MRLNLLLLISICLFLNSCQSSSSGQKIIVLENIIFSKEIRCSTEKADRIEVWVKDKQNDKGLNGNDGIPYFEFVVDNQLVSSNDKLWVFNNMDERNMTNGGTEYSIVFEGKKNPVEGLKVKLLQQIFQGSTLMREKMELSSEGNPFHLNKLEGKLHFSFPGYALKNELNESVESIEIRMASWEKKPATFGGRKKGNHMYYPDMIRSSVSNKLQTVKGPISILSNGQTSWLTAYEHASQDDLNGMFDEQKLGSGNLINDAMQGTKGVFNFPIKKEDFRFLGVTSQTDESIVNVSVEVLRGGYLDGEVIDKEHPYSTVWTASGFYDGGDLEDGKAMIRNYLFNQICEKPASRVPEFYYNTWGMQRNDKTKPLRGILTYDRIFEEIEYAAELGVDIFVLDDGWENTQGEWFPNKERLNKGLAPIKKKLDVHGIKMGLWYSPMGIDSTTQSYKDHQDWVIKDSEGNPILAQWNHPAFDFVGGFFDVFVEDCKKMIDEGCRFMKWDAINTFYSSLPNLEHGSDKYSSEEIRARYEYLLPIYVVRAMEILTDYEPELIIEMDVTEARRVMVGLAPLSQGKMFWMNNGASWYNDYSNYRTKSMRTIANEFAGIIPLELFTYANYPHNLSESMKYNVNNSLLGGHGFWGNLKLMSSEERKWIGSQVKQSKLVLPYLLDVNPKVIGKVGDSPEIYSVVNGDKGAGQIIAFTEKKVKKDFSVEIQSEKILAALNHPYRLEENELYIPFNLKEKESSVAVIVLPNEGGGITIKSSTAEIINAMYDNGSLEYKLADIGDQVINWEKKNGIPKLESNKGVDFDLLELDDKFQLIIKVKKKDATVVIKGSEN